MKKSHREDDSIFWRMLALIAGGVYFTFRFLQGDHNGERIGCVTIGGIVGGCLLLVGVVGMAGAEYLAGILGMLMLNVGAYFFVRMEKAEAKKLQDVKADYRARNQALTEMPDPSRDEIETFHAIIFKRHCSCLSDEAAAYTLKKYKKHLGCSSYMDVIEEYKNNNNSMYVIENWPTDTMHIRWK